MNVKKSLGWGMLICALIGMRGGAHADQHFSPVENTGNTCAILIVNILVDDMQLQVGDEIGIFDDDLCVGATVYQSTMPITCAGILEFRGPNGDVLVGAKNGNPIEFRIWDQSSGKELPSTPFFSNGGSFGDILTIVYNLVASSSSPVNDRKDGSIPKDYTFLQNYPNPFNPSTTIEYHLPVSGWTRITVYDLLGHQIRSLVDEVKSAGTYKTVWDGRNDEGKRLSSGAYFIKLEAGSYTKTRKMLLVY